MLCLLDKCSYNNVIVMLGSYDGNAYNYLEKLVRDDIFMLWLLSFSLFFNKYLFYNKSTIYYLITTVFSIYISKILLFSGFLVLGQPGLPLVQQYLSQFEQLVREHMPKLGEHFTQEMINPSMYASQWFITVFSYSFPFPLALRIWDVFLYEVSDQLAMQSHFTVYTIV